MREQYTNYAEPHLSNNGSGYQGNKNVPFILAIIAISLVGVAVLCSITVIFALFTPPLFLASAVLSVIALIKNKRDSPKYSSILVMSIVSLVLAVVIGIPVISCSSAVVDAFKNSNGSSYIERPTSIEIISASSKASDTQEETPVEYEMISLKEVLDEVDNNPVRVSEKYLNKPVEFLGYVIDISQDLLDKDKVIITLNNEKPNGYLDVVGVACSISDANMKAKVAEMNPGDEVAVEGHFKYLDSSLVNEFEVDTLTCYGF